VIRNFLASDESVLRLSLRQLSFRESIREIVANAIGRHLLELGRQGAFVERPLVILVDEAHLFLNQQIGDAHWTYELDAFELIAKEGRKYALTTGLATQRPRDIPEGVLSQIGTFIVHGSSTTKTAAWSSGRRARSTERPRSSCRVSGQARRS
jgi:uncharacterized protein